MSKMQTWWRKHPRNKSASIYLVLQALASIQDFMACYHNYCLIMLPVAYLTFSSTGESSVHLWPAAHCARLYRPSPHRCVSFLGAAKKSMQPCADAFTLLSERRCCCSCLFPCLEGNFLGLFFFVFLSSGLWCQTVLFHSCSKLSIMLHLWPLPLSYARLLGFFFSFLLCFILSWLPVCHEETTILFNKTELMANIDLQLLKRCNLLYIYFLIVSSSFVAH